MKTYTVTGRANVQVRAEWSVVNVTTSDDDTVQFDVQYQKPGADAGPRIDSSQNGNLVALTARLDEHAWRGWSASRRPRIDDGKCELSTGTGGVDVAGRFESLDIVSRRGNVTAQAMPGSKMSSGWSIRAADANVDLSLPTDFKASLDARTDRYGIGLNLALDAPGDQTKMRVRGTLNGGGPELFIRATNGAIRIGGV